jgi:hypothetical protein
VKPPVTPKWPGEPAEAVMVAGIVGSPGPQLTVAEKSAAEVDPPPSTKSATVLVKATPAFTGLLDEPMIGMPVTVREGETNAEELAVAEELLSFGVTETAIGYCPELGYW